ncbi:MAG: TonB-dependent receptor [Pseudomonadota bacterium]
MNDVTESENESFFGVCRNAFVITNSRRIHCVSFLLASGGQGVAFFKKQQHKYNSKIRTALYASTFLAAGLFTGNMALAQSDAGKEYNIPPSDMSEALQAFSEQSDAEIIYAEKDVAEKTTKGIEGEYSRERALEEIIGDSGLVYEVSSDGVIIIKTAFLDVKQAGTAQRFRVAQADRAASQPVETIDRSEADDPGQEEEGGRDIILVTGTSIRGIAPDSSPTRTFDRQDIQISGAATAQDFIQTLPQNFGGGSNADITGGLPNDGNSSFNIAGGSFGSSVNLRGLGSGSTLVLLNGHRLAPSSGIGDFVDISMIPASALERIEVLTDGASSIYGADAVAGVVNFVLRDDFDGVEASYRYGTVTEGGLTENRASATGGKAWADGNALIVYEYFNQGNLSAEDRLFSQDAVLPNDLLPSQERHSVLASLSQELTPSFEVFSDFLFSTREAVQFRTNPTGGLFRFAPSSDSFNVSAGGSWEVSDAWFVDFSGTYSEVQTESRQTGASVSIRDVDSNIWTADARVSGDIFRMPGGEVKLAIGGHFRAEDFTNFDVDENEIDRQADREVYAVFGEAFIPLVGPTNSLPGVERLELNVSGRFEDFSDFGSTANPKVGVLWSPFEALNLRGSYSTSFNPPPLGRTGATDFQASAAPTSFFNDVLDLTPGDPSIADVVVITAFGTDSNLDAETSTAFTAGMDFNEKWGRHDFVVNATYFDIEFENRLGTTPVPGNRIAFDAPNIAFNNPELFPAGTVIFSPTTEQINNLGSSLDTPFVSLFGADPLNAEIINFVAVTRNLSRTIVSGFDFEIAYSFDSEIGNLFLGLDGTYLKDFQQQAADTTPLVEQVSTLFNPVDLRLRGRAGYNHNGLTANVFVNYTDGYRVDNTSTAENIDSWTTVDVSLSYDTRKKFSSAVLNNTTVRVSVVNLFDQNPPATPSNPQFGIFGFDPTNASPLNRFIALELTKAL